MGALVIVGLLAWRPMAYFVGAMMILAGLTGVCFLEMLSSRIVGAPASCSLGTPTRASDPAGAGLQTLSAAEIKLAVAEKYSEAARTPGASFNFPLDLGCGAGLDLFFYARTVGKNGRVYGLDLSRAMIDKARRNLESRDIRNMKFLNVSADAIPLPDASVDLVAANGIYNLSPDKDAVMREVYRVLKVGGRTVFAEIVLKSPLPEEVGKSIADWFRCIGGALPMADFLSRLGAAGFRNVQILWEGRNARTGHELAVCAVIRAEK